MSLRVRRQSLRSGGPEETYRIGTRIGNQLSTGSTVCIYGDVGAGKTTMIKGIASAFGIKSRDITSASFTIIAEYPTDPVFTHVDLYRLEEEDDVLDMGLYDHLDPGHVTVIEWAERLPEIPENAVRIWISIISENEREITIEGFFDEENWNYL